MLLATDGDVGSSDPGAGFVGTGAGLLPCSVDDWLDAWLDPLPDPCVDPLSSPWLDPVFDPLLEVSEDDVGLRVTVRVSITVVVPLVKPPVVDAGLPEAELLWDACDSDSRLLKNDSRLDICLVVKVEVSVVDSARVVGTLVVVFVTICICLLITRGR